MPRKPTDLVKRTYWIPKSADKRIRERAKSWNWSASMVIRDILFSAFNMYKHKPKPEKSQEHELG